MCRTPFLFCAVSTSLEFGHFSTKSHQRSWWIVHTQPTRTGTRSFPNPTNAVGGSFILSLHGREPRIYQGVSRLLASELQAALLKGLVLLNSAWDVGL